MKSKIYKWFLKNLVSKEVCDQRHVLKTTPSTLSLWKMHICVFPDHFSFNYLSIFGQFLSFLEIKTELIQFYTKF